MQDDSEYVTVKANYFKTGLHAYAGELTLGKRGLVFDAQAMGKITIPYVQMRVVWVQVVLRHFYRGIIVEAPDGRRFHFVTSRTRQLLHVLNQYLPTGTVRHYRANYTVDQ